MPFSIRNEKAEALARELARETGESLTQAILHALEDRLERCKGQRTGSLKLQDIMEISTRASALPDLDRRPVDEILGYGDDGY